MTASAPKPPSKPPFFTRLFGKGGLDVVEKQRMEAFFSALPLDYCGWSANGIVAYSRGFCRHIGIDMVQRLTDIQNVLTPTDAAALEGLFIELQRKAQPFTVTVRLAAQSRILRLHGQRGRDLHHQQSFDILWVEDVTDSAHQKEALQSRLAKAEKDTERLQAVLDSLPYPVWLHDARQDLVWCNAAYAETLGEDRKDVLDGHKDLSINLGRQDGKTSGRALALKAFKSKEREVAAGRIIIGGNRRAVEVTATPLTHSGMTAGFARDTTREEELKSDIDRYQSASTKLLEQFTTAIAIFSADQKLEFYNTSFSALWALEEQWLNTRPKIGEIMERLRANRKLPEQADFRAFKKSWVNMFTSLLAPHEDMLHLPDGTAVRVMFAPHPLGGLMMTSDDVTSRLELESSYNTLIAVQKETLDNLGEGVAVFGGDGRLKLWNPAYAKIWNLSPDELKSEPHIGAVADHKKHFFENSGGWDDIREKMVAHAFDRTDRKNLVVRDDGMHIEMGQVALPDGGVMLTYRNVTDTLRVERALREKAAALEEAEKLKMDFLANVSYQLRTPLNAIMGFSEILSNEYFGELNDRQKEYAEGIGEAGSRLMSLIDNILDLSTIEAGYLTLDRKVINVHTVLTDVFALTREWAGKETLHAALDCAADIGFILADERRLKQVILNLIRNAITFTPGGGKISLSGHRNDEKGEIVIAVSDTGIGIPEEDQSRVFEPFERSDMHDNPLRQSGPGLGLSLVKNIVDLHGGHVSLDSVLGAGTTISIHMPEYRDS